MPTLNWTNKHLAMPAVVDLILDSTIYPQGSGYPKIAPSGRLILGDNLEIMAALLPQYEGKINLIYSDPPFFTNKKFTARIGKGEDSRKPKQWKLAKGYHDDWANLDEYLDFLYQRLALMTRLLAPNGTLYLHLDWHADAYARMLLDELLGADNFINEIIWTYHGPSPIRTAFNRKHDTILMYSKGKDYTFNADDVREPYSPNTLQTFKSSKKAGFGKMPNLERGKVPEDWWYFPVVARLHNERTGYPTQKPQALLERIILASSNKGDLVADFFSGSGTTSAVASKHGRRFIATDQSWLALHTTRKRLAHLQAPFTLEHGSNHTFSLKSSAKINVTKSGDVFKLSTTLDVDYWELDPNWDGKIFKSVAQSGDPIRSAEVAMELKIKDRRKACLRLVTVKGDQYQVEL